MTPLVETLAEYVGRYTSGELEASYTVSVRSGTLELRRHGGPPRVLKPADRDAFDTADGVVQFTRDAANRIDGFAVYLGRVWHLRFDRDAAGLESPPRRPRPLAKVRIECVSARR